MPKVILDKAVPNFIPEFAPPVTVAGEVPQQTSAIWRGRDQLAEVQYAGIAPFLAAEADGTNDRLQTGSLVIVQSQQTTGEGKPGLIYTSDEVEGRVRPLDHIRARIGFIGTPNARTDTALLPSGPSDTVIGVDGFVNILPDLLSPGGLVEWDAGLGAVRFIEHSGFLDLGFSGGWTISNQPVDLVILLQFFQGGVWQNLREIASFTLSTTAQRDANWGARNIIVPVGRNHRVIIRRTDGGANATLTWREPSIDWELQVG